jgi:serine/threonine-protein kinase RsbW
VGAGDGVSAAGGGAAAAPRARVFPARLDALAEVTAFVEDACGAGGVPRGTVLRLLLVVEELFTNTVRHGHGGDSGAPVRLAVDARDGEVHVCYEDTAPPYDPFAAVRTPADLPPDADRPVGGLGVFLVTTLARAYDYVRAGDTNRITLVLPGRP